MSRSIRLLLVAAVLSLGVAAGAACGKESTGPVAGVLKVNLTTPNSGADGAILLTVTGPTALTGASAGTGLRLFGQPGAGTSNAFALTGTLKTGAILTIGVADVNKVSQYGAAIQQVAATADFQLRTLTGYSLTVAR